MKYKVKNDTHLINVLTTREDFERYFIRATDLEAIVFKFKKSRILTICPN